MKEKIVKVIKIVDDITYFLLEHNISRITTDFDFQRDKVILTFKQHDTTLSEEMLTKLLDVLNEPLDEECEYYYWSLSGDFTGADNLSVVSRMIDFAEGKIENGVLTMKITRIL